MDISSITNKILPIVSKYPVKKMAVFGSYARGTQTTNSDIDLVVELSSPMGLNFFTMRSEIQDSLGIAVDLVTYRSLKPIIKDQALLDQVTIYAK